MKLSRISRITGDKTPLNSANVFEGNYQGNLEALYQAFNVRCYCLGQDKPVNMHIRKMQSSGLFFLADNPTSPTHSENCTFYSARKNTETMPDIVNKVKPFELTTKFNEKVVANSSTKKTTSSVKKTHPRKVMSGLEGLFVTLISNAFCDYNFGGFVSVKDVVTRIIENKANSKIKTGDVDLVSCIYFGDKGVSFAKNKVEKLSLAKGGSSELPVSLWFGLVYETGDDFVVVANNKLTCGALYMPHKTKGPYLAMGTVIKYRGTDFKQILLIPVVSKSIVLPVYSELQREKVLALQKWVYGRNRSGKYRFYIQKPLKPIVDDGKIVLADLLVVSKNKATGDKFVLALAGRNTERISSVYDSETIKLKDVNIEVVSQHFSRLLTEKRKNSALMRE